MSQTVIYRIPRHQLGHQQGESGLTAGAGLDCDDEYFRDCFSHLKVSDVAVPVPHNREGSQYQSSDQRLTHTAYSIHQINSEPKLTASIRWSSQSVRRQPGLFSFAEDRRSASERKPTAIKISRFRTLNDSKPQ